MPLARKILMNLTGPKRTCATVAKKGRQRMRKGGGACALPAHIAAAVPCIALEKVCGGDRTPLPGKKPDDTAKRCFYLYDPAIMQERIAALKQCLPQSVHIYYAMKANPHPAFLEAAGRAQAAGIEIASQGEGEIALQSGFSPAQLIFTGPGKTPEELDWAAAKGLRTVHIESLAEAHRLNAICAARTTRQDILVRVNPNFHIHGAQAHFSGAPCKLGIDEDVFRARVGEILALPHLRFRGLHVYAASGVLKVADLLENCRRVFALARDIESASFRAQTGRCDIIDFGGGFGVDYAQSGRHFSPEEYANGLTELIARYGFEDRTFILELGRYLSAGAGWYCTEILDIKTSMGKKQIICAGGTHHFRRPAALGISHPLTIVPMNRPAVFAGQENIRRETAFIGGPLCNTADRLASGDVYIDRAEIGDIAVISLAGAYGLSMSHTGFLSHPLPAEIILPQ